MSPNEPTRIERAWAAVAPAADPDVLPSILSTPGRREDNIRGARRRRADLLAANGWIETRETEAESEFAWALIAWGASATNEETV